MKDENKEIDYSNIENQIRLLVDYIAQDPNLFFNKDLGITVIPYEVNILVQEYANDKLEKNKDLSSVSEYSEFLDGLQDSQHVNLVGEKTFYWTNDELKGMTPKQASTAFIVATEPVADKLTDIRKFVERHAQHRQTNSFLFFEDCLDQKTISDFYALKIEDCMLTVLSSDFRKIDEANKLPRPKSEFEIFAEGHSDISILEGEYEEKEFKEKQVEMTEKAEAFLIKQGENLIKRIEAGDKTSIWNNPIFTLQAKNPSSNYVYNIENMSALNDAVSERSYQTALFLSFDDAIKNGFSVPKGTVSHEIIQRFGKKTKEITQLVNGIEEPVLDANGEKQFYWKRCMKTANVFNIDQLEWRHTDKVDPRIQWIAENKKPAKLQSTNEAEIKQFSESMKRMINADGIKIVDGGKTCFFSPSRKLISMTTLFRNSLSETGVLAHEFMHSTGVANKLNRESLFKYKVSEAYRGYEELVANCGARKFIMHYGLDTNELNTKYHNSEDAYDLSWALPVFKKDPALIMQAMISAEQAFQYSKEKMDVQLKLDNIYGNFIEEKNQYKKPTPSAGAKKPYVKKTKQNNNKRSSI